MDAFDPSAISLLDRERIVAKPGFNRWLVPPAALAIHLCIGMAYGFSVFWLPLSRALAITKSVVWKDMSLIDALTTTTCDWRVSDVTVMYTLFFVVLGNSASGGAVSPPLLPRPFAFLSRWLPSGATVTALRDAVYFRDYQHTEPIVVLTAWATLLFGAWLLVSRRRDARS